jgi:hypothetical protein
MVQNRAAARVGAARPDGASKQNARRLPPAGVFDFAS